MTARSLILKIVLGLAVYFQFQLVAADYLWIGTPGYSREKERAMARDYKKHSDFLKSQHRYAATNGPRNIIFVKLSSSGIVFIDKETHKKVVIPDQYDRKILHYIFTIDNREDLNELIKRHADYRDKGVWYGGDFLLMAPGTMPNRSQPVTNAILSILDTLARADPRRFAYHNIPSDFLDPQLREMMIEYVANTVVESGRGRGSEMAKAGWRELLSVTTRALGPRNNLWKQYLTEDKTIWLEVQANLRIDPDLIALAAIKILESGMILNALDKNRASELAETLFRISSSETSTVHGFNYLQTAAEIALLNIMLSDREQLSQAAFDVLKHQAGGAAEQRLLALSLFIDSEKVDEAKSRKFAEFCLRGLSKVSHLYTSSGGVVKRKVPEDKRFLGYVRFTYKALHMLMGSRAHSTPVSKLLEERVEILEKRVKNKEADWREIMFLRNLKNILAAKGKKNALAPLAHIKE